MRSRRLVKRNQQQIAMRRLFRRACLAVLLSGSVYCQAADSPTRIASKSHVNVGNSIQAALANYPARHGDQNKTVDLPPVQIATPVTVQTAPSVYDQLPSNSPPGELVSPETVQRVWNSNQASELSANGMTPNAWWQNASKSAMQANETRAAFVDIETLVQAALQHSPFVQSMLTDTQIQEAEIQKAWGEFDPTRFAESIFRSTSDPVGNTLTTGGPPRLNEIGVDNSAGVKKKNTYGGSLQASQEIFLRDNNSIFLAPREQADTKMAIRYTQPLMRGAGQFYNRSAISVAEMQYGTSLSETQRVLQQHVVDITQTYWELYSNRCQILQISRGIDRLNALLREIERRKEIDGIDSQILLATALIANQNARRVRASSKAATAETHLRRLVNAPWLTVENCDELVPVTSPFNSAMPIDMDLELQQALGARPDIVAIRDRIKTATVKMKVAESELKPTLNLVTSMYVHGLNGNYDVGNSIADQYASGRPSVTGGLSFQRPRNNKVANAIKRQKSLEVQKLLFELEEVLLKTKSEIYAATADVNATFIELQSSGESAIANVKNVEYLAGRWANGSFVENTAVSLQLQQLLNAEQDLITAENNWAAAEANYMIALAILKFRSGDLLSVQPAN